MNNNDDLCALSTFFMVTGVLTLHGIIHIVELHLTVLSANQEFSSVQMPGIVPYKPVSRPSVALLSLFLTFCLVSLH